MDAAETFALPQDLVFVDLETTGGNAAFHRITEVGIVRMQQGRVVEEWSSLVNPDCRIPSYIEAFTGITNDMVAEAPRFAEIAAVVLDKLRAATDGEMPHAPVFVAHNARFDYSFLRSEFRRAEVPFSSKVLCTVKLSRRLFPEFPRHSLDAVMERHGLTCSARHRALGDARVLADFWQSLCSNVDPEKLCLAAKTVLGANRLPAHLPAELADELPEGPGVYRLFGEDNVLLYIGKSHSLRTRVLGHFGAENSDAKEQKKARLVRRVDWCETAGDLGAQLKEALWIKQQKPLFNQRLKQKNNDSFTLQMSATVGRLRLTAISDVDSDELRACFGIFQTHKDGRKALGDIARAHSLCLKVLGFEESTGSCFAYQVGKCKGVCLGKEPLLMHTMRVQLALSALKLKAWPFPGRIALVEGREFHVLEPWSYLGTARSEEELTSLKSTPVGPIFDVDVYRILVRYFAKHPSQRWHDLREKVA